MSGLDEFELIEKYFAPLAAETPGAFGLKDDAAVLDLAPGENAVVTTDTVVAGVHFLADDPPGDIARKALRVSLSDLAAMGARPCGYTLAAVLPVDSDPDWLAEFAAGLRDDQAQFGVSLLGGDTVAGPGPLSLTVTALGAAKAGRVLRRSGAAAGEDIYVSGTLGDAALGLRLLRGEAALADHADRDHLIGRYRVPAPRLDLGQALLGVASAAIDLSDGLVADFGHLCAESGVAGHIELARVPLLPAVQTLTVDQSFLLNLLAGGDDYELLFTAPPAQAAQVKNMGSVHGLPVTCIGRTSAGTGVVIHGARGEALEIPNGGYRHSWRRRGGAG